MSKRRSILKTRFNKDGTIVLLSRGRVQFKHTHWDAIEAFKRGWNGEA